MVTRKLVKELDDMKMTLDEVHKEISIKHDYPAEADKISNVIRRLNEFRSDLDDLEHVVLAEGLR